MSTSFEIRSSTANYLVSVGSGLFESFLHDKTDRMLIADERFLDAIASSGRQSITISANEASKSLDAIPDLIVALRERGANRQTELVALGGGTVQDAVAFIASVYMRGVQWTYVPTTLLAMADSCIGGKSSINVGPYKNLVGTFHPPKSVLIDPRLVPTLTEELRVCGLIEAAKICFCRGEGAFREYLALEPESDLSEERVEELVICSLQAKRWFIEVDEFDRSERLLLNFGHTFGHAIEGASHFKVAHGVGVGVGILCAIELGKRLGRSYGSANRIHKLKDHVRCLLSRVPGLLKELEVLSLPEVLDRFKSDKKHGGNFYTAILVGSSGDVELARLQKNNKSLAAVQGAIECVMDIMRLPMERSFEVNEI